MFPQGGEATGSIPVALLIGWRRRRLASAEIGGGGGGGGGGGYPLHDVRTAGLGWDCGA